MQFVNQELRQLKLGIDVGLDLDKTVDKLKEEKLVASVSKAYAKSGPFMALESDLMMESLVTFAGHFLTSHADALCIEMKRRGL